MSPWALATIAGIAGFLVGWILRGQMGEAPTRVARPLPATPADLEAEARSLLERREKIQAIKLLREATPGLGLKEAKDAVDAMEKRFGL